MSDVNKIDWTVEGEVTWSSDVYLMKFIAKWYVRLESTSRIVYITMCRRYGDFVSKRLSQPGICYSANRKAFISKATMPFKAEEYSDFAELTSLCRLVGPYGVKGIDREIMRYIVENINAIKVICVFVFMTSYAGHRL